MRLIFGRIVAIKTKVMPVLIFLVFLLAACSEQDVSVYRVAKESAPPAPMAREQTHGGMGEPAGEGVAWTLPQGWVREPASGMRLASFKAPAKGGGQAEVSVVVLPGEAGGALANVNRWRGQMGLGAVDEKGLAAGSRFLSTGAGQVLLVDLRGQGRRMLAAILSAQGSSWFFKMTGEDSVVAQAKTSFQEFLGSLRLEE